MLHQINVMFAAMNIELEPAYDEVPDFLATFYMWNDTIKWHRLEESVLLLLF
jgi:hypothetical protein